MKCLVLGGGGFLGSYACETLLSHGYTVRVFEKELVKRDSVQHLLPHIEWVEGDFTNENDVKQVVQGVDYIVHAICTTLPKGSNDNPLYDISSNVLSTLHLLDASRTAGVKKVVFFSSGGTVYGVPRQIPIAEDHPTDPICSYGIQKLAIEKYLKLYHYLYGLDYAIMRISNPYGERQRPVSSQGAVAVFLYKVLKNEPIEIWGDGSVTRDYLHISDVASAIPILLKHEGKHKLFNIGSGKGVSLLGLVATIEKVIGRKVDISFAPARAFDVPVNILDNARARKELAWVPKIDFEQGIKNAMEFLYKSLH